MVPIDIKTMIDIGKRSLDNSFAVLCLEENRTIENIETCQNDIIALKKSLDDFSDYLKLILH